MQRMAYKLLSLITLVVLLTGQAFAFEVTNDAVPGEYLVKYKDNAFVAMSSIRSLSSVRLMDHHETGRILKVKVKPSDQIGALARLMGDPNVEYVVPNFKVRKFSAPITAENLRDQWAIKKINAEQAWTRAGNKGARKVVVAVIDTGVDYNHPNLAPNMVPGYDFRENDADPYDKTSAQNPGHGTHCAGIVGATGLIAGGIVGASPEVSMMPIRFLGEDGSGDLNGGIKSIDFAIEKGAQIISASWGATIQRSQAQPLIEAVKRADDAGVIFIAAAANDGKNNDKTEVYPANAGFPNTITVAASGPQDEKPSWSNYGRKTVHLAAPGLGIMSTVPNNGYSNLSGTSMATPLVSGLVAFLKTQDPSLTGAEARALLQLTGAQVQIETSCNCRVDALGAVDTLLSGKMFITPAAGTLGVGETMQFYGTNGTAPMTFELSNAAVGNINSSGLFTASAPGETKVSVRDSQGQVSTSLTIYVGQKSSQPPGGGPGQPPGQPPGGGECPLGDQQMCDIICQIQPTLPFCQN